MPDVLWRGYAAVLRSVLKAVFTIKWRIWREDAVQVNTPLRILASLFGSKGITHNVPMVTKPAEDAQERKHSSWSASKPMKQPRVSFSCQPFPSSYPFSQWLWTTKDGPSGGACHLHGAESVCERDSVLKRTLYIDSYKPYRDGTEKRSLHPSFDWHRRSVSFLVSVWALKDCLEGQIASTDALSPIARFLTSSSCHLRSWGWGLGPSVC